MFKSNTLTHVLFPLNISIKNIIVYRLYNLHHKNLLREEKPKEEESVVPYSLCLLRSLGILRSILN